MKKQSIIPMVLLGALFVAFSFMFSCSSEDREVNDIDATTSSVSYLEKKSFEDLMKTEVVGEINNNSVYLYIPTDVLVEKFNNYNQKFKRNLLSKSANVLEIEDKKYLRFYSNGGKVSTLELIVNENGKVLLGSTICESTACASGGGCVPDGLYCTSCKIPGAGPQHPGGDCKRTTTG